MTKDNNETFLQLPHCLLNGLMNKSDIARMEAIHGLINMGFFFFNKAELAIITTWYSRGTRYQ